MTKGFFFRQIFINAVAAAVEAVEAVLPSRVPEAAAEEEVVRIRAWAVEGVAAEEAAVRSHALVEAVAVYNNRRHHNNRDNGDAFHDLCRDRANIYL